jgi:TonB family protein
MNVSHKRHALQLAALSLLGTASAIAQPEPVTSPAPVAAAAPADVTPPALKTDSPALYPEQAIQEHYIEAVTVVLILDVDASGTVTLVSVEAPQGHGFDEAASAAAAKLQFDPAKRAGTPVASRIKFQYTFAPPAPRLVGRLTDHDTDEPVPGAVLTVRGADGREQNLVLGADGAWQADALPPGPVHLSASAPGYGSQDVDEELTPGEETNLAVRLSLTRPLPPTSVPGQPREDEPQEIVVRGVRPPREVTKRTLTRDEIDHIPGTNGDALRSIQSLPGVARPPPFSGTLIVRGSAPLDTIIFVEGVEVPLVYHFGGLSSVVPTEMIDQIDFYPANYSSVYGRGTGGMVDVGLRDPRGDRVHGLAQVDLIDARLMLEGPIFDTGWKFMVGARRSTLDLWIGPVLESTNVGVTTAPRYYDYQLMLQNDVTKSSSFRLSFFGSDDTLEILNASPDASSPEFGGNIGSHTSFWRAQAHYRNRITDNTEVKLSAAVGADSVDIGVGSNFLTVSRTLYSSRGELRQKFGRGVHANLGFDLIYYPYDLLARFPPFRREGVPEGGPLDVAQESNQVSSRFHPAVYTEWELIPWLGARVVPGFRADYSSGSETWDLAPRINVRQDLTRGFPRSTIKGGVGIFYQPPTILQADPTLGNSQLESGRAVHYDLGFEQELAQQIELSTDLFYKALDNLPVPGAGNAGEGRAYGAEWLLKYKADERFFGWLAYTLSRSERRDTPSDASRLLEYDQTHILTVLGSYKLGRGWQLGSRFRFVSGGLYTPDAEGALDTTTGANQPAPASPPFGARLPAFHQLDVRVDKVWTFASWKLTFYADLQNVYFHPNPEGISYNYNYTQSTYANGLPFLPSLGLRGEF